MNTTFTALLYAKVDYEKVYFMNIKNVHKKVYDKYYGCWMLEKLYDNAKRDAIS